MIFNLQGETLLLILRSFLSGVILGGVYDVFATALKEVPADAKKTTKIIFSCLLFVFDFLFCVCCGATALLLMYYSNRGFFRSIVLPVMFIGFISFRVSIGVLFRKLLRVVYGLILRLLKILLIPLKFIKSKLILLYRLTIGKILAKIVLWVRTVRESRRLRTMQAAVQDTPEIQKEEDFVYVGKGAGYKRNGRIKF